ncbi:MAG: NADH ubiquinone oxidoreductase 20 kDa subunit [Candidatus Beckwithbacteria bacterium GW2011_GWB1_47_15]|uniref:NADH ubiquinone oxidoreductase 20 kDa subunit n=1 Tax=Candidatus Beckwithbacteria bacterium GW2011_GWB1_47_15 TaxID=1618371 RepID=A0A0G1RVT6_9BACT|nr:MAG: NADH ubiquinone oxidoreductase 20 kDa subunit [Candidatus Beckwithbacteria bacterium GW2011_GWC1_49_16]KKU35013.1 MAG: NADH ubiquinone oxidoreductase 20 kDa subunit [Candidatus Beckwithbacteria bacterium GW2011_GWA1_46_30]KKU61242.1 MAG: NADH ubiquinone oxidoreductase 20 kDa subunit [Candidatus Beckwithbacteria bacterium GW2011_GWB1_47_15]KKU71464.1 MAG: NADH ubiquinone oxidoreductase 20 kDa subunit [Candidatus Beckwithbacteria bacterium GW2011_GWA2_47_25]KKW03048.1 MAG: NADH ubiquinone
MAKLTVGWFTFTCCEDSTIIFTELLNQHWQDWTKKIDFKYAKTLRRSVDLGPMDVAFVEGAISSVKQSQKLKQIRSLAKILVAIGSCAITGQPSAQRNEFNQTQKAEIKTILERFDYADKVQKLSDLVAVDHSVPGCPMDEQKFLSLINKLIHAPN